MKGRQKEESEDHGHRCNGATKMEMGSQTRWKRCDMWRRSPLLWVVAVNTFRVFADAFDNILVLRIDPYRYHSQKVDETQLAPQLQQ